MFIKVCMPKIETLYNCENYSWKHLKGESFGVLTINNQNIIVECNEENSVYIMNDHGKTIDRKTWK